MFKKKDTIAVYQKLQKKHRDTYTAILNLQREKDYEINKMGNAYDEKMSVLQDRLSYLDVEIEKTEKYLDLNRTYPKTEVQPKDKKRRK